jgi:hypothetical protein
VAEVPGRFLWMYKKVCEISPVDCVVFHKTMHTGHMGDTKENHSAIIWEYDGTATEPRVEARGV